MSVVFQPIDILSLLSTLSRKNRASQASFLEYLEEAVDDKQLFMEIREHYLDTQNRFFRTIVTLIFGDIEVPQFNKRRVQQDPRVSDQPDK
jgi:hypothetical protein